MRPSRRPSIGRTARFTLTALGCFAVGWSSANAQINCSFETGLAGWTLEYGKRSGCTENITWGPPDGGTPLAGVHTGGPIFGMDPSCVPDAYHLSQMARINDGRGSYHATRLSQTFAYSFVADDLGGVLSVEYGAALVEPSNPHPTSCQPYFEIKVSCIRGSTTTVIATHKVTANAAAAGGWRDCSHPTQNLGGTLWYKHGAWCTKLRGKCGVGDDIKVELMVVDCGYGGHGAFAFLDKVCWADCTEPPPDMVGWWHDRFVRDLARAPAFPGKAPNNGSRVGPWGFSATKIGSPLFGGIDLSSTSSYGRVPDHNELDFVANEGLSIDCWVRPNSANQSASGPLVTKLCRNASGSYRTGYMFYLSNGKLGLILATATGFTDYPAVTASVDPNDWTHVAVTVDRSSGTPLGRFFVNGDLIESFDPSARLGDLSNAHELRIGGPPDGVSPSGRCFHGDLDEIELFERALDPSEVQAIFSADCKGKCKPCNTGHGPGKPWWLPFTTRSTTGLSPARLGVQRIEQIDFTPVRGFPKGRYLATLTVTGLATGRGGRDVLTGTYDVPSDRFWIDAHASRLNTPGNESRLVLNDSDAMTGNGGVRAATVGVFERDGILLVATRRSFGSPFGTARAIRGLPRTAKDPALARVRGRLWLLYSTGAQIRGARFDPARAALDGAPATLVDSVTIAGYDSLHSPLPVTGPDGDTQALVFYADGRQASGDPFYQSELFRWGAIAPLGKSALRSHRGGLAGPRLFSAYASGVTYPMDLTLTIGDDERHTRGASGRRIALEVRGNPGSIAAMLVGHPAQRPLQLPGIDGVLALDPSSLVTVGGTLSLDSSGSTVVNVPIPSALEGDLGVQALAGTAAGGFAFANNAMVRL